MSESEEPNAPRGGERPRPVAVFDTRAERLHLLPCPFARSARFQEQVIADGGRSGAYVLYDDLATVPAPHFERLCQRCFREASSLGVPPDDPGYRAALAEWQRTRDAGPSDGSIPGPDGVA